MLTSGKIVGFVPTGDYDKARAFYEDQLGFEFVSLDQYALVMNAGGTCRRIGSHRASMVKVDAKRGGRKAEDVGAIHHWLRQLPLQVREWAGGRYAGCRILAA